MVFELLNPEIQKIVKKRFKEPTLPQKLAIPLILQGKNVLLEAPVGTGKTEGAFLPILHLILEQKSKPISFLYITPLRALNRDMINRLVWWCNELGVEISLRHGDTSSYERRMQAEFPPQILITTPETLQAILPGKKIREYLKNVKWVVLDEVHEIADSKRGVQLSLALERIRELCGNFQIIGLSATIGSPESVAKFISPNKEIEIVKAISPKEMKIEVIHPEPIQRDRKIAEKIFSSEDTAARLRSIMQLIENSNSSLLFTNTREFAEILASRIKILDKKFPVSIHHSSLSKQVRIKAEKELKEGKIKSIICTSSLQLGIDIGSVDLVLQYQSPRQVTQLIQRVGRSGHKIEGISRGVIITSNEDDIFESAVIARKALKEELEELKFHFNSLDVLAHQIVGLTLEYNSIDLKKAYEIFKRSYFYKNLSYKEFLDTCEQLKQLGLIFLNSSIRKKRRGFEYYFSQLSTIPSLKQFKIFNILDNSFVGVLDEEFVALHGEIGSTFVVKGEAWKILDIVEDKVLVEPTIDFEASIPAWEGELIPVPFEVAQEVGKLRSEIAKLLTSKSEEEIVSILTELYPIDINCAKKMVDIIKKQFKFGIPDEKNILIESYEDLVIIHACFGSLVNETLGRFISALLTSRIGSIALRTDPYRIMIKAPVRIEEYIKEILLKTNPKLLRTYIELSIAKSNLFEWKFVHVAKRFGAISKDAEYGKMTLKKIIEEYEKSPIYKETLRELEVEKLDIEKAEEILEKIQKEEIKINFVQGLSPIGKLGIIHKFLEVLGPGKPEKEVFSIFRKRLLDTKLKLICLNCGRWSISFKVKDIPDDLKCRLCEARLLGIINPKNKEAERIVRKKLRNLGLTKEEEKKFERIRKSADLFLTYRKKAAYCLAGKGIGPDTAIRILSRFHKDENELIRDVLEAERQYLKTKRFWKI